MDPNSPEAMAKALAGDPYEHMFGSPPQGNVAQSALDVGGAVGSQMNPFGGHGLYGLAKQAGYNPPGAGIDQFLHSPEFNTALGALKLSPDVYAKNMFKIFDERGGHLANVKAQPLANDPSKLWIDFIESTRPDEVDAGRELGTRDMLSLIPEVQKYWPNVTHIGGRRVSGARWGPASGVPESVNPMDVDDANVWIPISKARGGGINPDMTMDEAVKALSPSSRALLEQKLK